MRATLGFVAGMTLTVIGLFALLPVLGATGVFVGGSETRVLLALATPPILGGGIAGAALGHGWRGILGFSVAFPVGVALPVLAVVSIQAMSGRESLFQLLAGFVGSFALSFGLMGGIGTTLLGTGWRRAGQAALAFAGAGAAGGVVLVGVLVLLTPESPGANALVRLAGSCAAFAVAAALGGWSLGRLVASRGG